MNLLKLNSIRREDNAGKVSVDLLYHNLPSVRYGKLSKVGVDCIVKIVIDERNMFSSFQLNYVDKNLNEEDESESVERLHCTFFIISIQSNCKAGSTLHVVHVTKLYNM